MPKGFPAVVRASKLLDTPDGTTAVSALLYDAEDRWKDPSLSTAKALAGNFIAVDDFNEAHQIGVSLKNRLVSKGLWEKGTPLGNFVVPPV